MNRFLRKQLMALPAIAAFVPFSLQLVQPGEVHPSWLRIRLGSGGCEQGPVFRARVAASHSSRSIGLSRRTFPLASDEAMIFLRDTLTLEPFWMKDTWIPLTVLFFGSDSSLISAHDMAVESNPSNPTRIYAPSKPYWVALEVEGLSAHRYVSNESEKGRVTLCVES